MGTGVVPVCVKTTYLRTCPLSSVHPSCGCATCMCPRRLLGPCGRRGGARWFLEHRLPPPPPPPPPHRHTPHRRRRRTATAAATAGLPRRHGRVPRIGVPPVQTAGKRQTVFPDRDGPNMSHNGRTGNSLTCRVTRGRHGLLRASARSRVTDVASRWICCILVLEGKIGN